jgi:integrase
MPRSTSDLQAFALVSLNTGCRRNETLSITPASFDRPNRLVRITETKNGAPKVVHLNDTAFAALESLPRPLDKSQPLFPFGPNQVSVAFLRAVRRAGIEDFHLHDLRHTYLSYQAMSGAQGRTLQELAGHRTIG